MSSAAGGRRREMYRIGVTRRFDAAHRLEGHPGPCSRLHGHTWAVEAVYSSHEVGPGAMVLDFGDARRMLDEVIEKYDHRCLNEIPPFDTERPTAENVARVVYTILLAGLERGGHPVDLVRVTVWESAEAWASYGGDSG